MELDEKAVAAYFPCLLCILQLELKEVLCLARHAVNHLPKGSTFACLSYSFNHCRAQEVILGCEMLSGKTDIETYQNAFPQ